MGPLRCVSLVSGEAVLVADRGGRNNGARSPKGEAQTSAGFGLARLDEQWAIRSS